MRKIKTKQKMYTCPKCNYEFPLSISRLLACSEDRYGRAACRHSSLGDCGWIRCPSCDNEFPNPDWPSWMKRKQYEQAS